MSLFLLQVKKNNEKNSRNFLKIKNFIITIFSLNNKKIIIEVGGGEDRVEKIGLEDDKLVKKLFLSSF